MKTPIFPLGIVLYPEQILPLHIFEDRYKRMTTKSLDADSPFVIVYSQDSEISKVGCLASIHTVLKKYEDGRFDILVEGSARVEISDIEDDNTLLHARVTELEDEESDGSLTSNLSAVHMRFLELKGHDISPQHYKQVSYPSFFVAREAGLSHRTKQFILEMNSEKSRQEYLLKHLGPIVNDLESAKSGKIKVQSNGHFNSNGHGKK